jgi:hypothetical protein
MIFGDRPSVRLPRRTVPICVSEPIGLAKPFRIASTPAIVVVLTAPRPTSRIPSLPRAGAISMGADTGENYISFPEDSFQLPASGGQELTARLQGWLLLHARNWPLEAVPESL